MNKTINKLTWNIIGLAPFLFNQSLSIANISDVTDCFTDGRLGFKPVHNSYRLHCFRAEIKNHILNDLAQYRDDGRLQYFVKVGKDGFKLASAGIEKRDLILREVGIEGIVKWMQTLINSDKTGKRTLVCLVPGRSSELIKFNAPPVAAPILEDKIILTTTPHIKTNPFDVTHIEIKRETIIEIVKERFGLDSLKSIWII